MNKWKEKNDASNRKLKEANELKHSELKSILHEHRDQTKIALENSAIHQILDDYKYVQLSKTGIEITLNLLQIVLQPNRFRQ